MEDSKTITVYYKSVDHYSKTRRFKTLKGAQVFAQKCVGATPEISEGFGYAVSGDGVGKVQVEGCSIAELFPSTVEPDSGPVGYACRDLY